MFGVFRKTMRDKRFFILGWSIGLAFLGFLMTSFYTSFNGRQIDELLGSMPGALQGLVGDLQDWRTLPGYIGSQVFDIRLPIFIAILSILLAVSITVGEEEKGQLRTLIALPISRRRIIFGKMLAVITICFIASFVTLIGLALGLLVIHETIDPMVLVRLGLFTWLLVSALAAVIFAIGAATGSRAFTTGVGIMLAIGGFLLSTFAQGVDWLADFEWLSLFHYFPAVDIANGVVVWQNMAFYLALTVLSMVVALLCFPHRDVKGS